MRGRKPSGPAVVERLAGSALARQRLQVVLETLAGTCRVQGLQHDLQPLTGQRRARQPLCRGRPTTDLLRRE